jgi:uncharacterized phosphosugar-binding protein
VGQGEITVIVNANGINPITVDAALESKRRGLNTSRITSASFAEFMRRGVASRHSSGKNLHEIVDVSVDCAIPLADACVQVEGCPQKVALVSTLCSSFCLQLLDIATVGKRVKRGIKPPLWMSANLPEGDKENQK